MTAPYYIDDTVTLYHGDCREILPTLGMTFDCAIADPPYEETSLGWDIWPTGWLEAVAAVTDSLWCWLPVRAFAEPPFRGVEFTAAGWKLSQDIEGEWDHMAWEKHNGSSFANDRFRRVHEIATHWYQGRWGQIYRDTPRVPYDDNGTRLMRSVIRARSMHGRAIHPTEKPVDVLIPQIQYGCAPGGLVVDPCAGSCSTGVAARLSGRRAVLIEADEAMCEKAVTQRLQQDVLPLDVTA